MAKTVVPFCVIALMISSCEAYSQAIDTTHSFIQITAGLGVSAHSDPTINNYINSLTLPSPDQKLMDFTSASEFFVTPEFQVGHDWSVGLEYSYLLKSYNVVGGYQWNFTYTSQMSTLLVHYLVPGEGYWLKFGGGIGYAYGTLTEQFVESGASENSENGKGANTRFCVIFRPK